MWRQHSVGPKIVPEPLPDFTVAKAGRKLRPRVSLLQGHNCHSGQTLRGGSCVLRFTGCGANCLERWLDDDTGRRQRRHQTHSFRDAADRVAVFLQLFACLGSAFFFDADRVALIVCGSQGANWWRAGRIQMSWTRMGPQSRIRAS